MRIFRVLLVVVIALGNSNAWSEIKSKQEIVTEAKSKAPHITSQQLAGYLSDNKNFVLLDVRTEAEFEAGHIQGARWLPRGKLEFVIQEVVKDPDSSIVVYCRTGAMSALSTLTLLDMGYAHVVDLDGGFEAWVTEGNPVYNQHGELKVVSYQKQE
jgi:rhodanese-related sulfurtransferase